MQTAGINKSHRNTRLLRIAFWLAILALDLLVYLFLGVLQMDYDDSYDWSKGAHWSLASMNERQLIYFLALQLWNVLNITGLVLIGRLVYKRIATGKPSPNKVSLRLSEGDDSVAE